MNLLVPQELLQGFSGPKSRPPGRNDGRPSQESAAELGASAALEMREAGVPIDAVMRSALRRSHRIALRQALDVDVIAGLRGALTQRQTPS